MAVLTRTHNAVAYQRTGVQAVSHASLPLCTSTFRGDTTRLQHKVSTHNGQHRQHVVEVQSFKFMKKLGLKKPEFLPDFGKDKRLAMLNSFFSTNDKATLESMLSDNVRIVEEGTPSRTYNKSEFVNLLCNHVVPAIPDFDWCHATSGENDKEGYAVVTCQASGQHSGKPLRVPGSELPKVEPKQKQFKLQPADLKVKIEDGKIHEIIIPSSDAGFLAIYQAVGGKMPSKAA